MILALLLASLIGLALGLLGSGGSIITLPVLVYVAGIPVTQAVAMSLVVVGGTSAVGSFLRFRQGEFAVRAAILFTISGIPGAIFGAKLTHFVQPKTLMLLFGCLMLIVGPALLRKRAEAIAHGTSIHTLRCLAAGASVGVLTGFLGVGGGFLILPALILFAGLEMKTAIGTISNQTQGAKCSTNRHSTGAKDASDEQGESLSKNSFLKKYSCKRLQNC